jgi:CcmD family protein
MTMVKRLLGSLVTVLLLAAPLAAAALQPPTGAARDGFVPLDSLPPQEQLPAAPLLITAYVFVWVLLMTYLWSIARRLGKVEREMHMLQRRSPGSATR